MSLRAVLKRNRSLSAKKILLCIVLEQQEIVLRKNEVHFKIHFFP